MGLDAMVYAKLEDIYDPELKEEVKYVLRQERGTRYNISLRIGSYAALHYLRNFYTMVYSDINKKRPDVDKTHLLNHSDCDGYYIDWEFSKVIWTDEHLSIGSSTKLLQELEFLKEYVEGLPENGEEEELIEGTETIKWVFKALYLLARVSVDTNAPLVFL